MSDCRWLGVCSGGCPFDRAVNDARGAGGPEGCCGLSPLLDDMEAITSGATPSAVEAAFGPYRVAPITTGVPVSIGSRL